jgi:hypothetical protein
MAKLHGDERRMAGHPTKKETARRKGASDLATAMMDDLIGSLRGRYKSKDSPVEAFQRERRIEDRIKSRKLHNLGGA